MATRESNDLSRGELTWRSGGLHEPHDADGPAPTHHRLPCIRTWSGLYLRNCQTKAQQESPAALVCMAPVVAVRSWLDLSPLPAGYARLLHPRLREWDRPSLSLHRRVRTRYLSLPWTSMAYIVMLHCKAVCTRCGACLHHAAACQSSHPRRWGTDDDDDAKLEDEEHMGGSSGVTVVVASVMVVGLIRRSCCRHNFSEVAQLHQTVQLYDECHRALRRRGNLHRGQGMSLARARGLSRRQRVDDESWGRAGLPSFQASIW
jgi:hypothetical protein